MSKENIPVTVVVRRRTKPGCQHDFETAMGSFAAFASSWPGNRGIAILRPAGEAGRDYLMVDHFEDLDSRQAFKASAVYGEWMERLSEFSEAAPDIKELEGLASWFTPPAMAGSIIPPKWKMAVVTSLGVYPLTAVLPPLLNRLLPWPSLVVNVVVTVLVVGALNWAVMPWLTRVFSGWLHPVRSTSTP
jgi:uncharacterized protein